MPDIQIMNIRLLRSEIAMYLHSNPVDHGVRKLLEQASLALAGLERALYELEQLKS